MAGKKLSDVTFAAPDISTRLNFPAGVSNGPVIFKIINDIGDIDKAQQASISTQEKIFHF